MIILIQPERLRQHFEVALEGSGGDPSKIRPMTEFPAAQPGWPSATVLATGAWKAELVTSVLRALALYPEATLVDIGCNIGQFTVMAATLGHRVVAVDTMADNLAYIHNSLVADGREGLVTLVHSSVSNDEDLKLYPVVDEANPGSIRLVQLDNIEAINYMKALGPPTPSILLPDLFSSAPSSTLIVKMDLEGWECKALLVPGVFHTAKFIPYIFMVLPTSPANCVNLEDLLELFAAQGYTARYPTTLRAVEAAALHTPLQDVLWVHKQAHMI